MHLQCRRISFYLLAAFYITILFSCNNKNSTNNTKKDQIIHFNVSNWEKDQKIPKKVIKKVRFIPLETKEDCLLGEIDKIISVKNRLYILDRGINKQIFVFNTEGKYLGSIGKYGKGPGEFISLSDFIIDDKKNQLLVLDAQLRKVLTYNLQDANFLNELKVTFLVTDFVKLDDNVLSFYSKFPQTKSGINYSIANMNLKDKSYKWFLVQDEYDTRLSYSHSIFQSENTYFASYFKDIIYRITADEVEPFITIDFGKNKIPKEKLKNIHSNLKQIVELLKEKDWTYGIENVFENNQFLTFNFKLEKHNVMVIYSKITGNYFYGNQYEAGLGIFRLIKNIAVNDNQFLGVINAFNFKIMKKIIIEQGDEEFKEQYLQTLNLLSDQSNPVVISIEYNNF